MLYKSHVLIFSRVLGSDKTIKEISASVLKREIDLHVLRLTSVTLSFDRYGLHHSSIVSSFIQLSLFLGGGCLREILPAVFKFSGREN